MKQENMLEYPESPRVVQKRTNLITIACGPGVTQSLVLRDPQLRIQYR
ncbi:hypothetical protein ACFL6S_32890 [Candidatus Poribacteria bacterium]